MNKRRAVTTLLLICVLSMVSLINDNAGYADSGDLSNTIFRIGLHHGANSLPAVELTYAGKVEFYTSNSAGAKVALLQDEGSSWQVHREAIRLEVGPFSTLASAEQTLARWPQSVEAAYVIREGLGFYVVGGLFFSVEQAWLSIPALTAAGITSAQARGTLALISANAFDYASAVLLCDQLRTNQLRARPHYDGAAWRIVVGTATDAAGLAALRQSLSQAVPDISWSQLPQDFRRLEVVRQDGTHVFSYDSLPSQPLRVGLVSGLDTTIAINRVRHRGDFEFSLNQDNMFIVIGIMDIDDYLKAVVPREMPASWPLEALKAQAVVARTYAYANRGKHGAEGFDICTLSTHCQAYGAVEWEQATTSQAVDDTKGVALFFNGRPASTFYHSDSGGHTESVENVWSSTIPYLVGVQDPYGAIGGSTQANWQIELSQQELQSIIMHNGGDVGTILSLRPTSLYPSGRIEELLIMGMRGNITFTKQQPRLPNGTGALYALRSTMYTVQAKSTPVVVAGSQGNVTLTSLQNAYVASAQGVSQLPAAAQFTVRSKAGMSSIHAEPTSFIFNGSGWGHGVGLSQWGAKGMADLGHSYEEILLHYYRGIQIVSVGQ